MNNILKALIKPKPLSEAWKKKLRVVYFTLVIAFSIFMSVGAGIASYIGASDFLEDGKAVWALGTLSGMFGMLALLYLSSLAENGIKILIKRLKK